MLTDNVVVGDIRLEGQPDEICIENVSDLISYLNKYAKFYIPGGAGNLVVGNEQPSEAERQKVWFRLDNGSNFKGIYVYSVGAWRKIYPVGDKQVFWVIGDSRTPPDGYEVIDTGIGGITTSEVNRIKALYQADVDNTFYTFFAVVFKGF